MTPEDSTAAGTTGDSTTVAGASDSYTFTIHKDGKADVKISNTYDYLYAPVEVTKTVTGNMGNKDLYFGFDLFVKDADNQPIVIDGVTDKDGKFTINLKHGEEKVIEKLPKGAKLEIIEHTVDNDIHYETSVKGRIGVGEEETTVPLEPYTDKAKESTYEYAFTIPKEGATTHFTNNYTVEQSVVLNKIGYNNIDESEVPLAGATFRIYADEEKLNPAEIGGKTELTSDSDGLLYRGKIGAGTYYLDETVVPDGYLAHEGMFILTVDKNGVTLGTTTTIGQPGLNDWISSETTGEGEAAQTVYTVSIRNTAGAVLPSTGGMGTAVIYTVGALLLVISAVLCAVLKRRAKTM